MSTYTRSSLFVILFLLCIFPTFAQDSLNVSLLSSTYVNSGYICDIATHGNYSFIANKDTGVQVLDTTDPGNVVELARIPLDSYEVATDESGNVLYVMSFLPSGYSYLSSYNISDIDNITSLGEILFEDYSQGLNVSGGLLISESTHDHFSLFDVSDPSNMAFIGNTDVPNSVVLAKIYNDYAYILTAYTLFIFDCRNTADIQLVFEEDLNDMCNASKLDVQGNYLYVYEDKDLPTNNSMLKIFDISNPSAPVRIATMAVDSWLEKLEVLGDYAFALCRERDDYYSRYIEIFDISDPAAPTHLGNYENGMINDFWLNEDYLILRKDNTFAEFVDYLDITSLETQSSYHSYGKLLDLDVNEDLVYIADGESGLVIYDIADENQPVRVAQYDFDGFQPENIICQDNLIFAADKSYLKIIDIADTENPEVITTLGEEDIGIREIGFIDDILYMTVSGTVAFYDVSDPATPVVLSTVPLPGIITDLVCVDDHLYVYSFYHIMAISMFYFSVVDISDISMPTTLSTIENPPYYTAFATDGQFFYCGIRNYVDDNLFVYDVSDPLNMELLSSLEVAYEISDIKFHEDYAYVNSEYDGLVIVNKEDPRTMFIDGYYQTAGSGQDVEIYEDRIITGDLYFMNILDFDPPGSSANEPALTEIINYRLSPAYPNPFNSSVRFSVTTPTTGDLSIRVFNILGKEVATIRNGLLEEGTHEFNWNTNLSTGIYFLEVSNGDDFHQVQKIIFEK